MCSSRRLQAAVSTSAGDSIRFFAWLIRESAARGGRSLSSMPSALIPCLTTAS